MKATTTHSEDERLFVCPDGHLLPKESASISVFDHGLLYGDGVFEGIRACSGIVFKLREHFDGLYESANYIRLKIPISKEEMIGPPSKPSARIGLTTHTSDWS